MSDLERLYAGRDYDLEYGRKSDDLQFWTAAARRYQPRSVLELAAGTGRIAVPLARLGAEQGFNVIGVDLVPAMLERARRRLAAEPTEVQARLRLLHADMRSFATEDHFDLALLGFNSIMHLLTLDDQMSAFAAVRRALNPGGRFIVDVFNPSIPLVADAVRMAGVVLVDIDLTDPETGERLVRTTTRRYLDATQTIRSRYFYERFGADGGYSKSVVDADYHEVFPRELELLYMVSGFTVEAMYGGYGWEPFQPGSPRMIAVGRAT